VEQDHGDAGAGVLRQRAGDQQQLRRVGGFERATLGACGDAQASVSGVITTAVSPAAWRSSISGAYSSEPCQRSASSREGNSMIAVASGFQSPSSDSAPRPANRKRPP